MANTVETYKLIPGSVLRATWTMFAGEKALANLDRPRRPGSSHAPQDPAAYGHVDEVGTAAQRVADTVAPLSARPHLTHTHICATCRLITISEAKAALLAAPPRAP